jgi:hypothetical protein
MENDTAKDKTSRTTIEITDNVLPIIDQLRVRDSIRNIVSAGILLYSRLGEDEKTKVVCEANGVDIKGNPVLPGATKGILTQLQAERNCRRHTTKWIKKMLADSDLSSEAKNRILELERNLGDIRKRDKTQQKAETSETA